MTPFRNRLRPLTRRMAEDMQVRNLSPRAIDSYTWHVDKFTQHFGRPAEELGPEQIREYQLYLVRDKQAGNRPRPFRLPGAEFVRRWSLHVLPKGFTKTPEHPHPQSRPSDLAMPPLTLLPTLLASDPQPPAAAVCAAQHPLLLASRHHRPTVTTASHFNSRTASSPHICRPNQLARSAGQALQCTRNAGRRD